MNEIDYNLGGTSRNKRRFTTLTEDIETTIESLPSSERKKVRQAEKKLRDMAGSVALHHDEIRSIYGDQTWRGYENQ